jgi:Flp pilus assembly protein TadB
MKQNKLTLKGILTAGSGQSSKRLTALMALLLLVIVVIAALYGNILPEYYVWGLIALIAGAQAFTLFQKPPDQTTPPPYD